MGNVITSYSIHYTKLYEEALGDVISVAKAAGFDLIIAETAGIGQGDSHIIDQVDLSMYVMTADFGAASQLEKIDSYNFV